MTVAFSHYVRASSDTMMLLLYTTYFISNVICYEVHQNVDEYENKVNVTTLYPVTNNFINTKERNHHDDLTPKTNEENKKILANMNKSNEKLKEENLNEENSEESERTTQSKIEKEEDTTAIKNDNNKKMKITPKEPKIDMMTWRVETFFNASKLDKEGDNKNKSDNNTLNVAAKEFKPSPHVGHFYDEETFVIPTQPTTGSFFPSSSFASSPKDFYKLNYKPPIVTYTEPIDRPYNFENAIAPRAKDWKHTEEPKPTVEPAAKIPAGGLYQLPDSFKEKPGDDGDDDDFGLAFKDDDKETKDNSVKKRGNPWKTILSLVTALIPVGIIISALTPKIVTLESTDNNPHFSNRFSRRSGVEDLPPISENCKRRLLCEIHSDSTFMHSPRRSKHCYKIQCEDPEAMSKALQWLLLYHRRRPAKPTRGRYNPYQRL